MKNLLCFAFVLIGTMATAEPIPAIPDDAALVHQSPCKDMESGEQGDCFLFIQPNGDAWFVLAQNGEPKLLRWVENGQPYITVWTAHGWGTF